MAMDKEKEGMRKAVLESRLVSLGAKLGMVRKVDEWAAAIVRGHLE
jgi:hypothetical protein